MSAESALGPVCVFVGPTLEPTAVASEFPGATILPPAAQSDVYRVAQTRPRAIAIIDGYFERVPAVWHKEILWALSQGIPVYGASSMGALRAAELAAFGMVGVGWIFEQFASGALTDDDEVAIVHASPDDDYWAGSEAMVNIRQTLACAVEQGVLSELDGELLTRLSKARFYPERCWPQVFEDAVNHCSPGTASELRSWLPQGRVDQKRLDALTLLRTLAHLEVQPISVPWKFNHTVYWNNLIGTAVLDIKSSPSQARDWDGSMVTGEAVLDELRLHYGPYISAVRAALLRTMATLLSDQLGLKPDKETLQRLTQRHCAALDIRAEDDHCSWMSRNRMDPVEFDRLAAAEGEFRMVAGRLAAKSTAGVMDHIRWTGAFEALAAAAAAKESVLSSVGIDTPSFGDAGADESSLYSSWFDENNIAPPENIDTWAADAGYGDIHAFRRMLLRDMVYRRLVES